MSNSQSLLAYPDAKEALDRVMLGRGLRLTFKSPNAAARFVARCNAFRMLDRKENAKLYEATHSMHGRSMYDPLRIALDGNNVIIQMIALDAESITELEPPAGDEYDNT